MSIYKDKHLAALEKIYNNEMDFQSNIDLMNTSITDNYINTGGINLSKNKKTIDEKGIDIIDEEAVDEEIAGFKTQKMKPLDLTKDLGKTFGKTGNTMGAISGAISNLGNLAVTLSSKEKTKSNPFAGYATDALAKIGEMKTMASRMKDLNEADLKLASNTQRSNNRNSARGINELRALDISTHVAGLGQKRKIENDYQRELSGINTTEINTLLNRDATIMGGQERTDIINQQNKDSFKTSLSQNLTDIGNFGQNLGKNENISELNDIGVKLTS